MDKIQILSIEEIEEQVEVYDITVEDDHSFLVEGIFVHNCIVCGSKDGKIYYYGKNPAGVLDTPPLHPLCRCCLCPITKSWKELGYNVPEVPPSTRASFTGQVPETLTYNDWLKQMNIKDPAFVKDILGPKRYNLWESGELELKQMVRSNKVLRLDELAQPLPLKKRPVDVGVISKPKKLDKLDLNKIAFEKPTGGLKLLIDDFEKPGGKIGSKARKYVFSKSKEAEDAYDTLTSLQADFNIGYRTLFKDNPDYRKAFFKMSSPKKYNLYRGDPNFERFYRRKDNLVDFTDTALYSSKSKKQALVYGTKQNRGKILVFEEGTPSIRVGGSVGGEDSHLISGVFKITKETKDEIHLRWSSSLK